MTFQLICLHLPHKACGRGGRYVQCASACDTSCQTLDRPKGLPILCATACYPGCKCDKGFVKTRHGGTCVPIRECRKHG